MSAEITISYWRFTFFFVFRVSFFSRFHFQFGHFEHILCAIFFFSFGMTKSAHGTDTSSRQFIFNLPLNNSRKDIFAIHRERSLDDAITMADSKSLYCRCRNDIRRVGNCGTQLNVRPICKENKRQMQCKQMSFFLNLILFFASLENELKSCH